MGEREVAGKKVNYAPVSSVQIEVTRNGYKLKVNPQAATSTVTIAKQDAGYFIVSGDGTWACDNSKPTKAAKAAKPAPRTVYSSGEYVFPDFASLSAWLKARVVVRAE